MEHMAEMAEKALDHVESALPSDFPEVIHTSVKRGMSGRLRSVAL
jgi:hypothetical protein